MNVGVAHSEENPNSSWLNSRGAWISYLLGLLVLHLFFRSVPFLHGPAIWTLTNVTHSVVKLKHFDILFREKLSFFCFRLHMLFFLCLKGSRG